MHAAGDDDNTYPVTFFSAAVERGRADCRATALLAKRAAVVRIMVAQYNEHANTVMISVPMNAAAENPEFQFLRPD
jgi:hypothetical protein